MTRKRFVKLLMAEGYSRNGANHVADIARKEGYSYVEGYACVARLLPRLSAMLVDGLISQLAKAVCVPASILMGQT